MSLYCGICVHLDENKKKCKEWNKKLSYMKRTGSMSFMAFEKCKECRNLEVVAYDEKIGTK